MKVRLLYFEDCPHYEPTLQLLRQIASERSIDVDIEMVEVESNEEARRLRFLGSPTLQVKR